MNIAKSHQILFLVYIDIRHLSLLHVVALISDMFHYCMYFDRGRSFTNYKRRSGKLKKVKQVYFHYHHGDISPCYNGAINLVDNRKDNVKSNVFICDGVFLLKMK